MKGIVFCEFIDFVEEQAGEDILDEMIERANPASGAAYTAVGKYDWREMVDMVVALSKLISAPVPDLIRAFGRHLFSRLIVTYPQFFEGQNDSFKFLMSVEGQIHVEVLKLYPEAELPKLDVRQTGPNNLIVGYTSCRPFGDLCVGMIEGCADHFGENFEFRNTTIDDGLNIQILRTPSVTA